MTQNDKAPRRRRKKTKADLAREAIASREYRARLRGAGVPTVPEIDAALAMLAVWKMHSPEGLHLKAADREKLVRAVLRFAGRNLDNEKARGAVEHRIRPFLARPAPWKKPAAASVENLPGAIKENG